MLTNLRVKDYGVLRDVDIEFENGLIAITGESGTGKSSLLRSITAPWEGSKNNTAGWVEGTWDDQAIGRIWGSHGSRSYPTINAMKTRNNLLPDTPYLLVRQGAATWLRQKSTGRDLVDKYAHKERQTFNDRWKKYELARNAYQGAVQKLKDLNRAGVEDIIADLEPIGDSPSNQYNTLTALEKQLKKEVEESAEKIRLIAMLGEEGELLDLFGSWAQQTGEEAVIDAFSVISNHHQELLKEDVTDEAELIVVQEKVYEFDRLIYRHGDPSHWEEKLANAHQDLMLIDNSTQELSKLKKVWNSEKSALLSAAHKLHLARAKAATKISKQISAILNDLGLQDSGLVIQVEKTDKPAKHGQDDVSVLWDPNKLGLVPVGKGASGGELSRIMLAIQNVLAAKGVYIYDEIDSGLSGQSLLQVGKYLRKQADSGAQVIAITHAPVIAAQADQQVELVKSKGVTMAETVTGEKRRLALLSMFGKRATPEEESAILSLLGLS